MKKRTKFLFTVSAAAGAMALTNHYFFTVKKYPSRRKLPEKNFRWSFEDNEIRYTVSGSGEPLLLIHRPMQSIYEWEEVITSLSKYYTVYALDLIGFGFSDKPRISYSAYLYTSLIRDFIKNIIGEKTNIAASSESCAFVYKAYKMEPSLFNKIIFVTPEQVQDTGAPNKLKQTILESHILGTFIYNIIVSAAGAKYWLIQNGVPSNHLKVKKMSACGHYGGEAAKYATAAYLSGYLYTAPEPMENIPVVTVDEPIHITNPKKFVRLCLSSFTV